jgi:hypothetical protein
LSWGCQSDRDCCNGLKCKGNSCTVGVSSPTLANAPVPKPVSAPVTPPTPCLVLARQEEEREEDVHNRKERVVL